MFDVGESPTGKTKIDLTMLDPLVFPSLPLAKGMGHDVQGLRRSVSSTSHGGAQSTSRSSVPSNHSASSRRNSATNSDYYRDGQTLRIESHSLPFSSSEEAHELLSKLPLDSPLFVKRTSGEWAYASLVARHRNGDRLTMSLNREKNTRKRCDRDRWEECLRLVNDKAVSADASFFAALAAITATASDTTSKSGRQKKGEPLKSGLETAMAKEKPGTKRTKATKRRMCMLCGKYGHESEGCWLLEKSEDTQPLVENTCPILAENCSKH